MALRQTSHRDRILKNAAILFAQNGYQRTGMAALERAIGLGRGALYYHIGDKEALLHEISLAVSNGMADFAEELFEKGLPADEMLRTLIRGVMRLISDNKAEVTVFYREFAWLTGDRRREVMASRARFESAWHQTLIKGEADGVFHPTTPVVRKGLLGMINYSYLWFHPEGELTAEEVADQFTDVILDGVLRDPSRAVGGNRTAGNDGTGRITVPAPVDRNAASGGAATDGKRPETQA